MATPAFQLNHQFIDQLWEMITSPLETSANTSLFHSVFLKGNAPTLNHLALIIEVAYWASFATEEGNSVTASLILRQSEHTSDTFHFDNPLEFSAKTLVKLGPALENPKADIGVWPDANGILKIWGFTSASSELIKSDFWVQILGPGRILILYSGRSIAAVTGNQAVFIDQKTGLQSMLPKIAAQAKSSDIKLLNLLRYNAILKIAQQMRAHGRGGTILVVPENKNWMQSIKAPIKYTGGANFLDAESKPMPMPLDDHAGLDQITHLIDEMNLPHQKDWIRSWQQVQQQCNRIARLTAVDGALVMNFDRYVYCFGANIQALNIKASSSHLRIVEPFENHIETLGPFAILGGTRHQSAAQFAYDQPGSITIAASQDGNVTFFSRDDQADHILTLQQAELILLHEGLGGSLWNLSVFTELGWFEREDEKKDKNYLSAVIRWMKTTLHRE
ncbi:MAG: hypothetical protein Q8R88_08980 [Desulfoprunum sp.]|nr:hypothetical protein [Desulfoprunum sp.]